MENQRKIGTGGNGGWGGGCYGHSVLVRGGKLSSATNPIDVFCD